MSQTPEKLTLTPANYHSNEANQAYMSHSQYQDFRRCEAMAMAKLDGWKDPENDALLVGSYVHAYFEGTLEKFIADHPEIISSRGPSKGELKSQYKQAETMIAVLDSDPFVTFVLNGKKEVIITTELFGAPWKAKMDVYNPDAGRIADIKTVKSIQGKHWDPEYGYTSFVEAYRYTTQLSLYAEMERVWSGRDSWLETLLIAVSKEDPPDKAIISLDEHRIARELEEVENTIPRILNVKYGYEEPDRCESCRYCRETKVLDRIIHYTEILPA